MMLDHLGETSASQDIEIVLSRVLNEGNVKTRDMGGKHSTSEMGDAIKVAILAS
jgi:tartrate dehydrogenase/decarboxylase/D-malate dehydrogenase